jgi:aryl-alcohol dehydrogenase-like predicted oxidoreductase
MEQRRLGRSGLKVSRLALGTMTWGRDTDEHEAADQLSAFLDAGGTLLDTAAGYGDGESERVIGRLLSTKVDREEVVLATKAGVSRRTGERVVDTSRKALLDSLDGTLQRLGTDTVDLWQVHAWSDETPLEETMSAVDVAVSSGRARYAGISNFSGWQTGRAVTWQQAAAGRAPIVSTQMEYSLLRRGIEREVLPAAEALGLGVLPWSPLGAGVLTGKYRGGTPADSRAASPHFGRFIGRPGAPDRRRGRHGRRRARGGAAGGGAGLGARRARCDRACRRSADRRPAARVAGRRPGDVAGRDPPGARRGVGASDRLPGLLRVGWATMWPMAEWEYQHLYLPRGTSRGAARRLLTDHAEYGHWELDRLRLFADGSRRVVLRRRVIRVARTA